MAWAWLCSCSSCTRRGAGGVLDFAASLKNCTRSASLKSGLRTRNTHRGRRPPEDEPKGQGARRARPPLVGCICGLAGSTSSAPALRCCRCCRVAWRGTVCPAPLPLGTACPIPCSSPHCTPVRVSCAPLPAKARVGPACSALPPPAEGIPWPFGHAHIHRVGWVGKKFGLLVSPAARGRDGSAKCVIGRHARRRGSRERARQPLCL